MLTLLSTQISNFKERTKDKSAKDGVRDSRTRQRRVIKEECVYGLALLL